jgi:hypothetical protein
MTHPNGNNAGKSPFAADSSDTSRDIQRCLITHEPGQELLSIVEGE